MATRFDLLPSIDMLVLKDLVASLQVLPENICVNCSIASIENIDFIDMVDRTLADNASLASLNL